MPLEYINGTLTDLDNRLLVLKARSNLPPSITVAVGWLKHTISNNQKMKNAPLLAILLLKVHLHIYKFTTMHFNFEIFAYQAFCMSTLFYMYV